MTTLQLRLRRWYCSWDFSFWCNRLWCLVLSASKTFQNSQKRSSEKVRRRTNSRSFRLNFVEICLNVGILLPLPLLAEGLGALAKSGPTHGLDVGSRHCGRSVVQSAHRWPGVGLVLEVCRWRCFVLQARHPLANTSCLGCMTARQCAKVLGGGSQW